MTYKLIADEKVFDEYIENFLLPCEPHERYYVAVLARKKYTTSVVLSDKVQLKRFSADNKWLKSKLRQTELPFGLYKDGDTVIPQEALAVYISVCPCDNRVAAASLGSSIYNLLLTNKVFDLNSEALNHLQVSGNGKIKDFDYDFKTDEEKSHFMGAIVPELKVFFGDYADSVYVLETRGGCHIQVVCRNIPHSLPWDSKLKSLPNMDTKAKPKLCPIPGCFQGDYIPRISKLSDF